MSANRPAADQNQPVDFPTARDTPGYPAPVVTLTILSTTTLAIVLQFIFPPLLSAFRRNPGSLAAGEWWRMITPLFVDPDLWWQIAIKLAGVAIVGIPIERVFGRVRWLLIYFIAGLIGEIAGYAWDPYGAGSSVALCGLAGALFAENIGEKKPGSLAALFFCACFVASLAGNALGSFILAVGFTAVAGS